MKRITAQLVALVLTVCALFAMTLNVSAASTETKEGLEVTIATDKTEYAAGEDILITITVKNTNSYAVDLPTIETLLPDGLVLISGNAVERDISVAAGATATVSVTAQLPIPEPPVIEPEPPVTEPPVTEPEPPVTEPEPPKTGVSPRIVVAALIAGLAIVGIIAACKSRKRIRALSVILCFAMLLGFVPIGAFTSNADNVQIVVDTVVMIDGNEYKIIGQINKCVNDVPEEHNDAYNVSFALNDGSNGTYEVQMIRAGERASRPADPQKAYYTFRGWFADPECSNVFDFSTPITCDITLYAGWIEPSEEGYLFANTSGGGTIFSIYGIEMVGDCVRTTINVDNACILRLRFLDENTESIITTVSTQTPDYCELTPVSIIVNARLPEHFIVIGDLLDNDGNKLCNSYTCELYTTAYETFSKLTPDDFKEDRVIRFGNSLGTDSNENFGVLSDDVIVITSGNAENVFVVSSQPIIPDAYDGTQEIEYKDYYIFNNPDEQVANLAVGDKIYVHGTNCLIKIDTIDVYDDSVVITALDEVEIVEFYAFLRVNTEIDVNETAEAEQTEQSTMDSNIIDYDGTFDFPFQLDFEHKFTEWFNVEIKLALAIKVKVGIAYAPILLGNNYKFSFETIVDGTVTTTFKLETDNKDELDKVKDEKENVTEIKLGKLTIPTNIPGLKLTTYPSIPVSIKGSASATIEKSIKLTSGFSYSTRDGRQDFDKREITEKLEIEGEFTAKVGPKLKFSVKFLEKVLQAELTAEVGVKFDAKLTYNYVAIINAESLHDCSMCISVELKWYVNVNVKLKASLFWDPDGDPEDSKFTWTFVDCDILDFEGYFPIAQNCYFSIINSDYSLFNGRFHFGWGECPNKAYKTTFKVKDENESEISDIIINVTHYSTEIADNVEDVDLDTNIRVINTISGASEYLFKGQYRVSCIVDGVPYSKWFEVSGDAQTITIDAIAPGTLSGKICKASDRVTPIPGATIEVYQNGSLVKNMASDDSGNYSMTLPAGRYFVRITAENYITFEAYARIIGRQNTYMETFLLIEGSDAESGIASGKVVNSLTGYGLGGVTLVVRNNWNNSDENAETVATTVTDDNGYYSFELPLGNYTVIATKDGYTSSSFNIIVQEGTTSNQNGRITPIIEESDEANYLITLTWGANPRDLDAHVVGTHLDGGNFHVYFGHKDEYENGDLLCSLDYDYTRSYGPEHITLNTTADTPYYYYIHHFAGSGAIVTSGAKITVERNNVLIAEFNVPTDLSRDIYWNVFAIKDGEIVISNTITSSPDISYADCR